MCIGAASGISRIVCGRIADLKINRVRMMQVRLDIGGHLQQLYIWNPYPLKIYIYKPYVLLYMAQLLRHWELDLAAIFKMAAKPP